MAVTDVKFSNFADGGDLTIDDIVVGLRGGVNTRFNYQGTPIGTYLPLAGGTMSGAINMDNNPINNLPLPVFLGDATSKAYVDSLTAPIGASGTFQRSNGTAWVASSSTIQDTYVLGDIIYASATNTLIALAGNTTTAKQYLSQTGTGVASQAPSWSTIDGGDITGAALTRVDDTNVTLTLGGTPTTALLRAVSLTMGWTGTLAVSRGGSGAGTLTGLLTGNGTSAFTGTAITQYSILSAGASNIPNSIAPSATSGVPLISQGAASQPVFGTAVVAGGGTGNTTFTAYSLICAGTTATGAFQNVLGTGSLNEVLVSQGAGALPIWSSVPGVVPAAMTKVDDTNVTLTLGGTPATSLLQSVSLTLGWTGQLGLTRGGTNASLVASNGGIVYSTATAMAILAGTATAGQILRSGSSAAPSWSTATYPATAGTSGNVLTSDGTNWVSSPPASTSSLTTNHIFVGNASNVATDVAMSGDATIVASGALTIANSAVTNAKMANMADQTIKGNVSGGSAAPSDLTKSQVLTMLGNAINQINTQTITTTGAFTYTPTTGTKYAIFELQGAGGGCGGTTGTGGQSAISGAGGGGAYIKLLVSGSTNLAAITGSVGAGGTAGSSGNNSGGTGGSTTLVINGGSTWTAAGGIGGTGKTSSASSQQSGTPADGGTATNGTNGTVILSLNGGQGAWGASFGNVNYWASAAGGNSILSAANGNAQTIGGTNYGSGSPGFFNFTGANAAGQAGANGVVVITEFISA